MFYKKLLKKFKNKKILVTSVIIAVIVLQLVIIVLLLSRQKQTAVKATPPSHKKRIVRDKPIIAIPSKLSIEKLSIETVIEQVEKDKQGNMDVPSGYKTVGWYSLGVMPGEKGNAVISGHVDDPKGNPAVFTNLKTLKKGDTLVIQDKKNTKRTFKVFKTAVYPYNNAPLEAIFGATSSAQLNLITCDGTWDKEQKTYTDRLVVFTQLVN